MKTKRPEDLRDLRGEKKVFFESSIFLPDSVTEMKEPRFIHREILVKIPLYQAP